MRTYKSIGAFVEQIQRVTAIIRAAETAALDAAATLIERDAKATVGHYQAASGPFQAWEELHWATLYGGVSPSGFRYPGKIELGYSPPDNPELRTGALRDSISHRTDGLSAVIGSTSMVMVYQELGTRYMSARPILGMGAAHQGERAAKLIGKTLANTIAGRHPNSRL